MKRYIAFMFGMVLIGSFFVVNKQIVREVPVFLASEMRLLTGSVFLYVIGLLRRDISLRIERADVRIILFQVFFGVFLFSIFSLNGLKQTSAVNSGIIMGLTPVVILLLGVFVKRERMAGHAFASCLIAFAGVIALQMGRTGASDGASFQGDMLVFLAMLGEAVFITAGRFTKGAVHPLAMSAFMSLIGALMFLPLALASMQSFDWASVSPVTWACVLYSGIGITAVGVFLMNYGAAKIPMSTTAALSALMPASTCILALVLLNEGLHAAQVLGLGLISTSAMLAVMRRRRPAT